MLAPLLTSQTHIDHLFAYAEQHGHLFGDAMSLLQAFHNGMSARQLLPTRVSLTYPADLYHVASFYLYVCPDFITLQDCTTGIGISIHTDTGYLFSCTQGTYTPLECKSF